MDITDTLIKAAERSDEWTESWRYMGTEILAECRKTANERKLVIGELIRGQN